MPMRLTDYPAEWKQIVASIRARAGDRCEALLGDGERCRAPNAAWVHRAKVDRACWFRCAADGPDCTGRDQMELYGEATYDVVRVVLTTAHTCDCHPLCGDEAHLLSLCQLHHLRLDAKLHAHHAAETRRRKSGLVPLPGLEVAQ